jgi:hypothetical protein
LGTFAIVADLVGLVGLADLVEFAERGFGLLAGIEGISFGRYVRRLTRRVSMSMRIAKAIERVPRDFWKVVRGRSPGREADGFEALEHVEKRREGVRFATASAAAPTMVGLVSIVSPVMRSIATQDRPEKCAKASTAKPAKAADLHGFSGARGVFDVGYDELQDEIASGSPRSGDWRVENAGYVVRSNAVPLGRKS